MNSDDLKKKAHEYKTERSPYWFVTSGLTLEAAENLGTKLDRRRANIGNMFLRKEDAKSAAEAIYQTLQAHKDR